MNSKQITRLNQIVETNKEKKMKFENIIKEMGLFI